MTKGLNLVKKLTFFGRGRGEETILVFKKFENSSKIIDPLPRKILYTMLRNPALKYKNQVRKSDWQE